MTSSFSRGRHGRHYPYYHCMSGNCGNRRSYAAAAIHEEFEVLLEAIGPRQDFMSNLQSAVIDSAEARYAAHRKLVDKQREQEARIQSQITQLIRMRSQELITDQEFVGEKRKLMDKEALLEGTSRHTNISVREIQQNIDKILQPLANLAATWRSLTTAQKQRFHQCVLPVGFVAGESRTAQLGLLFEVLKHFGTPTSHEVPLTGENWNRVVQEIQAFAALFDHSKDEEMAS